MRLINLSVCTAVVAGNAPGARRVVTGFAWALRVVAAETSQFGIYFAVPFAAEIACVSGRAPLVGSRVAFRRVRGPTPIRKRGVAICRRPAAARVNCGRRRILGCRRTVTGEAGPGAAYTNTERTELRGQTAGTPARLRTRSCHNTAADSCPARVHPRRTRSRSQQRRWMRELRFGMPK